jgi:integrase
MLLQRSFWSKWGPPVDEFCGIFGGLGKHSAKLSIACHRYGFHDGRRAFATMNAGNLSADVLQSLMRHTAYATTQRYINIARQLNPAVANLYVPEVLRES